MNHNQIIHKLATEFQTNREAQTLVWLRVWVCLVKKPQVDKLAQLVFGQPAAKNCITKCARGAVSLFTKRLFCLSPFLCLRPCLLRVCREICGQQLFMPETHLNNRQRQTQWADTHRTDTPVQTPSYICLIRYLHQPQLLIFTSHHIIETPMSSFQIVHSLPSTFPRTYKCPRARLVKWAIFAALTDLLTASFCPGPNMHQTPTTAITPPLPPAMCASLNRGGAKRSLDLNQTMNGLSLSGIGALGDRQTDRLNTCLV